MKIATSESHPIYVAWLWTADDEDGPGALGLTIAPGKQGPGVFATWQRDLATDLARLVELGATVLVPLLVDEEFERLRIHGYDATAAELGLQVLRFPFHDGGVPGGPVVLDQFLDVVVEQLTTGERVVVHCRGGLGRAGLVGACLLLKLGICATVLTPSLSAPKSGAVPRAE